MCGFSLAFYFEAGKILLFYRFFRTAMNLTIFFQIIRNNNLLLFE